MNVYDTDDLVELRATFKDKNGNLVDPSSVKFKIKKPSGTKVTYIYGTDAAVQRESLGVYLLNIMIDEAHTDTRIWNWRVIATGVGAGAENAKFQVRKSEVE